MKRALVTGGSGFIGAGLVRRLIADGHQCHLLVRRGYDPWRIADIRPDLHLHEVDLTDARALDATVARIRPDWVFNLAVHGAYSWQTDVEQIVRTNVLGTTELLGACLRAGFEAFVNSGSSSEYGPKDHAPSESEPLEPNSHYAVTKAYGTHLCRFTARDRNVHIVTLRLYSVFGPLEEPRRLMPTLIEHGLRGTLPPLVAPDVARDYVYLDDVIDAYLRAAARPTEELGAVYNVGTGVQTSIREAVEVARRVLGVTAEPQWGSMPNRGWDTNVWVADASRIRQALEWRPRYTFEEGFREMAKRAVLGACR
jgi:dolichol-phosphate mannosyltransferase